MFTRVFTKEKQVKNRPTPVDILRIKNTRDAKMPLEKKEDETEVIIDERHFKDLIMQLPEGIVITDLDENLLFVNKEFVSMLGYEPSELLGRNLSEIIDDDEIEAVRAETSKRRVGVSSSYILRMIRKDSGRIIVKISGVPRRDDQDNVIGTMAVIIDITAEKERELELLKLSGAIEASPTSVVITDTEGTIEYVNPKFTELTGYSYEEVMGENPRILKSGKTPSDLYERLWKTITLGEIWRGRFVNKKKNGELYWEDAWISPIKSQNSDITHYVAVKEDITKNVIAEEKLQSSYQDLEFYASFLAHDMRNDLQVLMSHAEAALMVVEKNSKASDYIKIVQAASERMVNLLDMFGRPAEEDETDIIQIIRKSKNQAEKTHSGLTVNIETSELEARIRSARLIQMVFDNLFRNTAEFSNNNAHVKISLSRKNDVIHIEVQDDGPGVPDEIKPKLFTKGISTTGGGYGLYLTRKVIEGYGGSIELVDKPGEKGAAFLIRLPAKE
jgi:two-component system cell cycle sensor histidine kinase/response regulator CckA